MFRSEYDRLINCLSEDVFSSFGLSLKDSPYTIVKKLGGCLLITSGDDNCVYRNGGSFTFTVSNSVVGSDFKYVVFMLVGHLFLHMGYHIDENMWVGIPEGTPVWFSSDQVFQAMDFANALSLPYGIFEDQLEMNTEFPSRVIDVESVAKYFGVSSQEVITRGKKLGFIRK